jgi:hypothetical protein
MQRGAEPGLLARNSRSRRSRTRTRKREENALLVSNWKSRIGGEGPVIVESDARGWLLIVRGEPHATGDNPADLHTALRDLALHDRDLARDAFGVVVNCVGAWEDEYTEEHGEDALTFEDWMDRLETGLRTWVDADGELYYTE